MYVSATDASPQPYWGVHKRHPFTFWTSSMPLVSRFLVDNINSNTLPRCCYKSVPTVCVVCACTLYFKS